MNISEIENMASFMRRKIIEDERDLAISSREDLRESPTLRMLRKLATRDICCSCRWSDGYTSPVADSREKTKEYSRERTSIPEKVSFNFHS